MKYGILAAIALALALPTGATAQVEWSAVPQGQPAGPLYGGEIIEVDPGDIETIWFHIPGETGSKSHLGIIELDFFVDASKPDPPAYGEWLEPLEIAPSIEYWWCTWYKIGDVVVDGPPCTYVDINITLNFSQPLGTQSVTIHKHIKPEPSSMLLLGTGVLGLLLRKRRL